MVRWYVCCEDERSVVQYRAPDVFYWRPCIKKTTLQNGAWSDVSEAAFPGYLFIGSTRGWRYIENLLIDVQLIRVGGTPHELTEKELRFARIFDEVQFNIASYDLRRGIRVWVKSASSAFAGLEGTVVQRVPVVGGEQACVEFALEHTTVSECLPLDHLEVIR